MLKKIIKNLVLFIIGAGMFVLILIYNKKIDWQIFYQINYWFLGGAFLANIAQQFLTAKRWQLIVDFFHERKIMPFYKYFFYLNLGYVVGLLGLNEASSAAVRVGALKFDKEISTYKSVNSIIIEKYLDFINVIIIALPCVLFYFKLLSPVLTLGLIFLEFVIIFFLLKYSKSHFLNFIFYLNNFLLNFLKKFSWFEKKINIDKYLIENKSLFLQSDFLLKINVLTIGKLLLSGLIAWFIFKALHVPISLMIIILIMPIVQLSSILAFTPAGLGIMEAGWFLALKLTDVLPAEINNFLITNRVSDTFLILLTALLAYLFFIFKQRRDR